MLFKTVLSRFSGVEFAIIASLVFAGAAKAQTTPADRGQTPTPSDAAEPRAPTVPAAEPSTPTEETGRKKAVEEIVVTGSRVRRKDLTTPAPVTVIGKEQIASSGIASIGDFLQQLPEQGGATNTNVNNGGDGQTQISLRNLGAQRTLVLVDGKRWVNGGSGAGSAVDLNSIPAAAIDHIEVLKDGASAVYGSDAIAGVVNIITRRRLNGVEFSAYGGMSPHGDAQQFDGSVTGGVVGDKGSFMFNAELFDQKPMLAGNRSWAANALSYDYGRQKLSTGGSGTIPAGRVQVDPSSCTTQLCKDLTAAWGGKKRYFMPDASKPACSGFAAGKAPTDGSCSIDGWRPYLSAADASAAGVQNDLYNYQSINDLITPSTRKSLFANGEYHISDFARAYFQGSFLNRQSSNLLAPEPLVTSGFGVTVSKDNPYNPFGIDIYDVRRRLVEYAGRSTSLDLDTVRGVAGIDGTLPEQFGPLQGVYWDLGFNYGRTSGTTTNYGSLNVQSVANGLSGPFFTDPSLITPTNPKGYGCGTSLATAIPNCVPVNLFGGKGSLTPDMIAALGGYRGIAEGWTQMASATANISAELFKLFSERSAGLAAGYEYRSVYGGYIPDPIAAAGLSYDYNAVETRGRYHVNEGYAELDIPVVGNVPFAEDVEVQVAARAFNYSTFGSDMTYKLGARWRLVPDLTMRGTYSTGFRAPDISDLYGGRAPSAEVASDPCATATAGTALGNRCAALAASQGSSAAKVVGNGDSSTQLNSTTGGNPALQPEKANIGTVGIVYEPSILRGFSLTADYYNIKVRQNLSNLTTAVILQGCYTGGNDAYCSLIHRDPNTGFINNVLDLESNVGSIMTSGIDLAARYTVPTDIGRFGFLFDSTYLIYIRQTLANGKEISAAGNYDFGSGNPIGGITPKIKFNTGINYGLQDLSLGVRGRYIGGFDECAGSDGTSLSSGLCSVPGKFGVNGTSYPAHHVPAVMTFDVFASYLIRHSLGKTTLSVGVRNLLDTSPPTVYNSFLTYADPAYDLTGRFVYGRVMHQF